jgi:hypothetical protein
MNGNSKIITPPPPIVYFIFIGSIYLASFLYFVAKIANVKKIMLAITNTLPTLSVWSKVIAGNSTATVVSCCGIRMITQGVGSHHWVAQKEWFVGTALGCVALLFPGCVSEATTTQSAPAVVINQRVDESVWGTEQVGNGLVITGYSGDDKAIAVPSKINGIPVVAIGSGAFRGTQLTAVTIPNSVTSIKSRAFYNTPLASVTIGNGVITIEDYAFRGTPLTTVTIPNSVTSIGDGAFRETQLTSVTIPNSVTSIGYTAFYNTPLTSVTIPNSVTSIGSGAFDADVLIIRE